MAEELAQVEGLLLLDETPKAYWFDDGTRKGWVPKSQFRSMEPEGVGETYTVTMTEWIAKEKGFI